MFPVFNQGAGVIKCLDGQRTEMKPECKGKISPLEYKYEELILH